MSLRNHQLVGPQPRGDLHALIVGKAWRKMWLNRLKNEPLLIATWLKHPHRDDYWKHGSVCENWNAIEAAALCVGGWNDAYSNAVPRLIADTNARISGADRQFGTITMLIYEFGWQLRDLDRELLRHPGVEEGLAALVERHELAPGQQVGQGRGDLLGQDVEEVDGGLADAAAL